MGTTWRALLPVLALAAALSAVAVAKRKQLLLNDEGLTLDDDYYLEDLGAETEPGSKAEATTEIPKKKPKKKMMKKKTTEAPAELSNPLLASILQQAAEVKAVSKKPPALTKRVNGMLGRAGSFLREISERIESAGDSLWKLEMHSPVGPGSEFAKKVASEAAELKRSLAKFKALMPNRYLTLFGGADGQEDPTCSAIA